MLNNKKTIFSGVAPSGNIHIGNYLGAIKQWVELQNIGEYQNIFLRRGRTRPHRPSRARKIALKKFWKFSSFYLALGLTRKSQLFVQSSVPEHSELNWMLSP